MCHSEMGLVDRLPSYSVTKKICGMSHGSKPPTSSENWASFVNILLHYA